MEIVGRNWATGRRSRSAPVPARVGQREGDAGREEQPVEAESQNLGKGKAQEQPTLPRNGQNNFHSFRSKREAPRAGFETEQPHEGSR
mmetsp:Transcript_59602/g.126699  ORF Transcript_59602/g.126699 Transcript_59602/m.126699 type:complete len:88 (+) Transcript_59602:183-446(+)